VHVSSTYLHVCFCRYVEIHQLVFDKNTCTIRTNRITDGGLRTESAVRASRAGRVKRASRSVCGPSPPVGPGRRAPRRLRQARGTDSKRTGEPGRPVTGLGSLLRAPPRAGGPDDSRWLLPGRRRPRCPDGPGPLRTTPHAPNRFHLVRALTGFPAHRTGGPGDSCDTCTLFYPDLEISSRCTVVFLPVLHPVIVFQLLPLVLPRWKCSIAVD
jgi:hypothetical protein